MAKFFYDHLVVVGEVIEELDAHALDPQEREELLSLAQQTLHHRILHLILDHLPGRHHSHFLGRLGQAPHDPDILAFLKQQIKIDIEAAIRSKASQIKKEILAEIKKSRAR